MGAFLELCPNVGRRRQGKVTRLASTNAVKLAKLREQSLRASAVRNANLCGETLGMLAYLASVAKPRAKSIKWDGIRFPLRQGFAINTVLCPETGQPLVSAVVLP